jgi:uncharacterized integral membrane protein
MARFLPINHGVSEEDMKGRLRLLAGIVISLLFLYFAMRDVDWP